MFVTARIHPTMIQHTFPGIDSWKQQEGPEVGIANRQSRLLRAHQKAKWAMNNPADLPTSPTSPFCERSKTIQIQILIAPMLNDVLPMRTRKRKILTPRTKNYP
jgi:hypothetical protein